MRVLLFAAVLLAHTLASPPPNQQPRQRAPQRGAQRPSRVTVERSGQLAANMAKAGLPARKPLLGTLGFKRVFSPAHLPYTLQTQEAKAQFQNVRARLKELTPVADGSLAGVDYLAQDQVLTLAQGLRPGDIVHDRASQKVVQLKDRKGTDKYLYQPPPFDQIIEDFEIPEQTVYLTAGNIERSVVPIKYAPITPYLKRSLAARPGARLLVQKAMQVRSTGASGEPPVLQFDFPSTQMYLPTPSGGNVYVTVNGDVKISDIGVDAKYTAFKGYKFAIVAGEEINLTVTATLQMHEFAYLPLCALDIPFGIGHVRAGIYLMVSFNGEAQLQFVLNQGMVLEGGVRGATFLYVPSGPVPYLYPSNPFVNCDRECIGEIAAGFYVGPVLSVELVGIDLLAAELRLGAELAVTASTVNPDNFLDVDVDAILYSFFIVLGQQFDLVNERWDLTASRELRSAGLESNISKADAYRRLFAGTVKPKLPGDPPFTGVVSIMTGTADDNVQDVELGKIQCSNGAFSGIIPRNNNNSALFDEHLRNGRQIHLKFTSDGQTGFSSAVPLTFPFHDLEIEYADLFNNDMKGRVTSVWDPDTKTLVRFDGQVLVTVNNPDGSEAANWYLALENDGRFTSKYNFLPHQTVQANVLWQGWEVASPVKETENGLNFWCTPVCRGERVSREVEDVGKEFLSMDDYVFIGFGLSNSRGTELIRPDVTAEARIVKPKITTGFNGWHLVEDYAEIPGAKREYTFKLKDFPEKPDQVSWTELYVYRWEKPERKTPGTGTGKALPADSANRKKSSGAEGPAKARQVERKDAKLKAQGVQRQDAELQGQGIGRKDATLEKRTPVANEATVDVKGALLSFINREGRLPDFTETARQQWKKIEADYSDEDQFDHNKYALLDGNPYNNGTGFIEIRASYEYEGEPFAAVNYFNMQALPQHSSYYRPPRNQESPRDEQFIQRQIEEGRQRLTHPDPDVTVSLDNLNRRYARKADSRGLIANERAIPAYALESARNMVAWGLLDLEEGRRFPDRTITKGELIAGLVRLFDLRGKDAAARNSSTAASDKYRAEMAIARERGILEPGDRSKPGEAVSREEASRIVHQALRAVLGAERLKTAATRPANYTDAARVSAAARPAVRELSALGLFEAFAPKGAFEPQAGLTVAQAATVLDRVASNLIVGGR